MQHAEAGAEFTGKVWKMFCSLSRTCKTSELLQKLFIYYIFQLQRLPFLSPGAMTQLVDPKNARPEHHGGQRCAHKTSGLTQTASKFY